METLDKSQLPKFTYEDIANGQAEELVDEADTYLAQLHFNAFFTRHHIDLLFMRLAYEHRVCDKFLTEAVMRLIHRECIKDYFWDRIPDFNSWLQVLMNNENFAEKESIRASHQQLEQRAIKLEKKAQSINLREEEIKRMVDNKKIKATNLQAEIDRLQAKVEKLRSESSENQLKDLRRELNETHASLNIIKSRYFNLLKVPNDRAMMAFSFVTKNGRKKFFKTMLALKKKVTKRHIEWVSGHFNEEISQDFQKEAEAYNESFSKNGFVEEEYSEEE